MSEENQIEENIKDLDLCEASKKNFLDYSMYVIVDRALPDIRDGLKPVHRRILWAQNELNNFYNKPYKKSARIVGDVIGKYHPHGDTAVYDALVRMAQPFSMRAPLIDGQGNFGSIDGDSAAAMRYTECRQSVFANSMFDDIGKETVKMVENYDGQEFIPEVLPLKYPNLLINGSQGIAVGMASYIPTHNPIEVLECVQHLLNCKLQNVDASIDDLMQIMPAPDFPTGGLIHDLSSMKTIWETGKGAVKLRAKWHEEETVSGNPQIVITEIPYQVIKENLVVKIAELARSNPAKNIPAEVEGITDINDESDKEIRVVITLKKDVDAEIMFNTLLKKTQLETSISYNSTVLVDRAPEVVGLLKILTSFTEFKEEVVVNRTKYLDRKASERAYVLEGLAKALDNLDKTIEIIRNSKNASEATPLLMDFLSIEEAQAKYVLEMKLSRLTSSQKEDLLDELKELEAKRKDYADILTSEVRRINIMLEENDEQMTAFANTEDENGKLSFGKRQSEFMFEKLNTDLAALTKEEECTILYSADGYIRRMPVSEFECQNRGTRGKRYMKLKKGDFVQQSIPSHSHDSLAIISKSGQVYGLKAYEIPDVESGRFIKNVLDIPKDEEILMILPVKFEDANLYLAMITKNGIVKRTSVTSYLNSFRKSGLRGIEIKENDELVGAGVCREGDDMVMVNSKNLIIRFTISQDTVRPLSRTSMGVKGMTLEKGVKVIGGAVIAADEDNYLACVTVNGMIKITPTTSYRTQNRGGKGVRAFKSNERTGDLFKALIVNDLESDLVTTTKNGISNRINLEKISITQRNTSGVKLIKIDDKDQIADVFNTEKFNEELLVTDDYDDTSSIVDEVEETEDNIV